MTAPERTRYEHPVRTLSERRPTGERLDVFLSESEWAAVIRRLRELRGLPPEPGVTP